MSEHTARGLGDDRDNDPFGDASDLYNANAEQLAAFVQEYVRRENQPDAGVVAVIASGLRDPQWLPHQVAERLLARAEIQALIKIVRGVYKPPEMKEVSIDSISFDVEALYQDAKDARQFTAALACKKLQAELHRLITKDVNVNVRHSITSMSDADLEAIAKRAPIDAEFSEVRGGLPATT